VRWDAFGEGAPGLAGAARRVIEETDVRVHSTEHGGRLFVRVWHPTLGFSPGAQPAWVGLRIQVPARGAYHVATEAYHGVVSVRRLTLAGATLRGRAGEKLKGIDGYRLGTELCDVTLAGDVDVSNPMTELGASVIARVRVGAFIAFHGSWNRMPLPERGVPGRLRPVRARAPRRPARGLRRRVRRRHAGADPRAPPSHRARRGTGRGAVHQRRPARPHLESALRGTLTPTARRSEPCPCDLRRTRTQPDGIVWRASKIRHARCRESRGWIDIA
jgi:hypothetical protein